MKKLISLLAALAVMPLAAFSGENWKSNINIGAGFPLSIYTGKGDASYFESATAFDLSYLGIAKNGFSVKAGFYAGPSYSNDIEDSLRTVVGALYGNSLAQSAYKKDESSIFQFEIGAGFTPIRTEKIDFTVLGMFGLGTTIGSYNIRVKDDWDDTILRAETSVFSAGFGTDFHLGIHFIKKFGLFADFSMRYVFGKMTSEIEHKIGMGEYEKQEFSGNLYGLFTFRPSLGLCISW